MSSRPSLNPFFSRIVSIGWLAAAGPLVVLVYRLVVESNLLHVFIFGKEDFFPYIFLPSMIVNLMDVSA